MRQALLALIGVGTILAAGVAAQQAPKQADRPDVELQAAVRAETVDGNLKGAIELYQKLSKSSDRAVAAQALVRMGQCYEKLGSTEARQAYERAVRRSSARMRALSSRGLNGLVT